MQSNVGGGLPPIAVGQSRFMSLTHRHRGQVESSHSPSHILIGVHPLPMHAPGSFESSIRTPIPPCINDPTGIFRHNKRTAPCGPNPRLPTCVSALKCPCTSPAADSPPPASLALA